MLRMFINLFTPTQLNNRNNEKKEIKQEETKPNYFKKLPDDILTNNLVEFTGPKAALAMAKTSKMHRESFKAANFGQLVAYGKQDQAEAILKKLKISNDEKMIKSLLSKKMNIIDPSGRVFRQITPFQYALWALDRHMWGMLLKYLSDDQVKSQFAEWEQKGVAYTKPTLGDQKEEYTHEKHFDFSPLKAALRDYIDHFETRSWEDRDAQWSRNVGAAQKNVPVHVAAEYCRSDRSFVPIPSFKEQTLPRQLDVFNPNLGYKSSGKYFSWFSASAGVGSDFGISRAWRSGVQGWCQDKDDIGATALLPYAESADADLIALDALLKVRTNEVQVLRDKLKVVAPVEKKQESVSSEDFAMRFFVDEKTQNRTQTLSTKPEEQLKALLDKLNEVCKAEEYKSTVLTCINDVYNQYITGEMNIKAVQRILISAKNVVSFTKPNKKISAAISDMIDLMESILSKQAPDSSPSSALRKSLA